MENQKEVQKKFNALADEVLNSDAPDVYKSVVTTVYSLIEDKRLISLDKILKDNYPEYYPNNYLYQ